MRRAEIKIVQPQSEEITGERKLSDEETKAFLHKNYPDLYKQMYPDQVIENKPKQLKPHPHQKREGNDIQKSNKTYVYNKYGSSEISQGTDFSYKIQIKTDMDINQ
jgi:hypothetical protein